MQRFFSYKINFLSGAVVLVAMVWNIYNIFTNTPMVPDQHWAQKIFYIHVPVAWTGFLSYFIVMVAGILYLINKEQKWDRLGLAAAEIGTLFVTLVLITDQSGPNQFGVRGGPGSHDSQPHLFCF